MSNDKLSIVNRGKLKILAAAVAEGSSVDWLVALLGTIYLCVQYYSDIRIPDSILVMGMVAAAAVRAEVRKLMRKRRTTVKVKSS